MTTAEHVKTISATAGDAVRIYRFVQLQADGKFDEVGATDGRADGVCAEAAAADGDLFAMALMQGVMKVEAGAALSVGDVVGSDTQGRAITSTGAANDYELGVALDAATDAGQIIRVLLKSAAQI